MITTAHPEGGTEYSYTVRDYAKYILDSKNGYGEDTIGLVKAMLNYGAYAQLYFNYNTDTLANAGYETTEAINGVNAGTLSDYAYNADNNHLPEGITATAVNLVLESETVLDLKFSDARISPFIFALRFFHSPK